MQARVLDWTQIEVVRESLEARTRGRRDQRQLAMPAGRGANRCPRHDFAQRRDWHRQRNSCRQRVGANARLGDHVPLNAVVDAIAWLPISACWRRAPFWRVGKGQAVDRRRCGGRCRREIAPEPTPGDYTACSVLAGNRRA